jgi:hypothetical protein
VMSLWLLFSSLIICCAKKSNEFTSYPVGNKHLQTSPYYFNITLLKLKDILIERIGGSPKYIHRAKLVTCFNTLT